MVQLDVNRMKEDYVTQTGPYCTSSDSELIGNWIA